MLPNPFFTDNVADQQAALLNLPDCLWLSTDQDLPSFITQLTPQLPDETITCVSHPGETIIAITGDEHHIPLGPDDKDRFLVLRWLSDMLSPKYDLRLFRITLDQPTWGLFIKPDFWWRSLERRYPAHVDNWFADIAEVLAD